MAQQGKLELGLGQFKGRSVVNFELVKPRDVGLLCAVEARAWQEVQMVQREGM